MLVGQDSGLGRWLEVELARRHGVAASLDVRSALALATHVARRVVPGARLADGAPDPFERAALAWRLSALLERLPDAPEYGVLRAYLDATGGSAALARRLAALYDDYQSFRPAVLAAWAEGAPAPGVDPAWPHAAWQAGLWRALTGSTVLDHGEAFRRLADRLETAPVGSVALPRRISVVGARQMPPLTLRVLAAMARHVPVTVYAVAPGLRAETVRAAVESESSAFGAPPFAHPLLRACGQELRETAALLGGLPRPRGAAPRTAERVPDPELDAAAETVRDRDALAARPALRQLQAALSADALPAPVALDPADRSIRVVDAHSPVRELEAVRDHLLDAFDALPGLRPHECLVVVPDLEAYAPLVEAVFVAEAATGTPGQAGGVRLPVHIVENPHAPAQRVLDAFRAALRLRDGRLAASELLGLLDAPAVRRRAGIAEAGLPALRAWLADAGVRWGLDGRRKAALGLPADDLHTWRFGLDRLLLGVACGPTDGLVLGRLPYDAAGLDGADLLGRFAEWAHALFEALARLAAPRPLGAWPDAVVDFVDALFAPDADEEHEATVFLRERAAELAALLPEADAEVPFDAVRTHLDGALGGFRRHEPFLTGRVTVARPYPLRHTPHRVVAFVGLDDGQVPAADAAAGYDLVAAEPRPGDAQPRRAEKQTFLDTVMACSDRLILSFVGRSQKDGTPRPASVVLDALLDAAEQHWGDGARAVLVETHRLQPFHPDYFGRDDGAGDSGSLFSYAAQHRVDARGMAQPAPFLPPRARAAAPEPRPVATLDELADAWAHPARYFMRGELRASLDVEAHAMDDAEPLVLGGLELHGVRAGVLDGLLAGHGLGAIGERLRAGGALPAGEPGAVGLRRAIDEAAPLAEAALAFGPGAPRALAVQLGERTLAGTAERLTPHAAVRVRAGRLRTRDLVRAWAEHLALAAAGEALPTVAIGTDGARTFSPLDPDRARLLLSALLRGLDKIRERPPPLFERASRAYAEAVSDAQRAELVGAIVRREHERLAGLEPADIDYGRHVGGLRKASVAFYPPSWKGPPGDIEDAYVDLAVRGENPFDYPHAFAAWAQTLWAPLLHHSREGLPA